MTNNIMVVEDNSDLRESLSSYLKKEGFEVIAVGSTEEGIDVIDEEDIDLGLIDINLPGKSGFEMIEYIRDQSMDIPLIALTARDGIEDKLKGFDIGATDYVVKPFNLQELSARVRSQLKTSTSGDDVSPIKTKNYEIIPKKLEFRKSGKIVTLTLLEFRMMHYMMKSSGGMVKVNDLVEYAWGEDSGLVNPPIRIHIANIRKKIDDQDYKIIKTIPGMGYIFSDEE